MTYGAFTVPQPANEPVYSYAPGRPERAALKAQLQEFLAAAIEIPLIIGGQEVTTGNLGTAVCPHEHGHVLARYHKAGAREVELAAQAAGAAWQEWARMPWQARLAIFLKAADLLATKYRYLLNAATMLNQSKTVHQAEIDSACELIDFYRFNPYYAWQIYQRQPSSSRGVWNYLEQRPLEGFVFAVTPFNFTSIAGNLPTSPAMMGNVVLWKPASTAVFTAYHLMKLLQEAGLPDGVINFLPGSGGQVGAPALKHPDLAGVHFTGSTPVFQSMWKIIGANIAHYKAYPRIVGETGGKDFVFVHASADVAATATALTRGAFEYQGQKCSAAARAYAPASLWPALQEALFAQLDTLKVGDVSDFSNFMGAVIDRSAFAAITGYIEYARASNELEIIYGGDYDDSVGYFIKPTVILSHTPRSKLMEEEIFGPVLTVYVYPDSEYAETLALCDSTSPYGLTGSIFAQDRAAIVQAYEALRYAAGNFYINDKPTGAIVGQQPFGGGRASGTNDKAGSMINLLRWVSPRAVKETFLPPGDYTYPFLAEE